MSPLTYRIALAVVVLAAFVAGYQLLGLPSGQELSSAALGLVKTYGPLVIFAAALLEGLFVLGWYFPGTFILVATVALSGVGAVPLPTVAASLAAGLFAAYAVDYALGSLGWYALLADSRTPLLARATGLMERYGAPGLVILSVHPNLGGAAAVAAGLLRLPRSTFVFYAAIACALWSVAWTVVVATLGEAILPLLDLRVVLLLGAGLLTVSLVVTTVRRARGRRA